MMKDLGKVYISGDVGILLDFSILEAGPAESSQRQAGGEKEETCPGPYEEAAFVLEAVLLLRHLGFMKSKAPFFCFREKRVETADPSERPAVSGRHGRCGFLKKAALCKLPGAYATERGRSTSRKTGVPCGLLEGGEALLLPSGEGQMPICFATLAGKMRLEGEGWDLDHLEDVPLSEAVPLLRAYALGEEKTRRDDNDDGNDNGNGNDNSNGNGNENGNRYNDNDTNEDINKDADDIEASPVSSAEIKALTALQAFRE